MELLNLLALQLSSDADCKTTRQAVFDDHSWQQHKVVCCLQVGGHFPQNGVGLIVLPDHIDIRVNLSFHSLQFELLGPLLALGRPYRDLNSVPDLGVFMVRQRDALPRLNSFIQHDNDLVATDVKYLDVVLSFGQIL